MPKSPNAEGFEHASTDTTDRPPQPRSSPIRIPHPLECAPRRPHKPRYLPRPRDPRDAGRPRRPKAQEEGWHSPTFHLADNREAVRINFTYRNGSISTSAGFAVKAGCPQYAEGPHEKRYIRFLQCASNVIDFQWQALRVEWKTRSGMTRSFTLDGLKQYETGHLAALEVKAHGAYFEDPEVADLLDAAGAALAAHGIALERIDGQVLLDPVRWNAIDGVYRDRMAKFGPAETEIALDLIYSASGTAPLGLIREKLHSHPRIAEALTNAMLLRRTIGFPLDRPVTADTPVHKPNALPRGAVPLRKLKF